MSQPATENLFLPADFDRRSGIGASLAPQVLGLSPYGTALEAYCYFHGLIPAVTVTEEMELGTILEPAISKALERRLGVEIHKPPAKRHESIEWMYASPDGLAAPTHGIEIKNVGPYSAKLWGEEGTDEAPEHVIIQAQHQAAVFGLERVTVAALICGCSLRLYPVNRNDALIARMIELEGEFWERVKAKNPPAVDWQHPRTPELIEALYQPAGGEVSLGAEAQALAQEYVALGRVVSSTKGEREIIEARLTEMMGTASVGLLPNNARITRKEIHRKAYSVAETSYIQFSVKEPRERKVRT